MAKQTQDPETLQELFAALDNDPNLIAECLARPVLADRFARSVTSMNTIPVCQEEGIQYIPTNKLTYSLASIVESEDNIIKEQWREMEIEGAPEGRYGHTAIWTGVEMIVWGGTNDMTPLNTGGRYFPATNSWASTSTASPCPSPRTGHSAVWTGQKVNIWGGMGYQDDWINTNFGGKYSPVLDVWQGTAIGTDCPSARRWHVAHWTGLEMIVWGGRDNIENFNNGGIYDPSENVWRPMSKNGECPSLRIGYSSVWMGSRMIIWGGSDSSGNELNSGGIYSPETDSWVNISTGDGCPYGRVSAASVWTGSELLIWGGFYSGPEYPFLLFDGGLYDPSINAWRPIEYEYEYSHTVFRSTFLWTGQHLLLWGGASDYFLDHLTNTGALDDPVTRQWHPTATGGNCPSGRFGHSAVWTGRLMIVWGGYPTLASGGIYRPYSPHERPLTPP